MAPSQTRIMVYLISAAVFITQHQGQATLLCDNFCTSNNVVTCTCEDTSNPFNKTVWELSNSTTSNSITLNQTGMCNATSGSFPAFPGIMAVNDAPMMTMCDSSTLSITKSSILEGLQINCMSPDGTSYGGIGFSTVNPGPPVVTICRAPPSIGFLIVHSTGGIPSSYNVTITIGSSTIKDSVSALSNGTATYSFPYSGSGIPLASATAINCAGNATSTAPLTFDPCSSCLTAPPSAPTITSLISTYSNQLTVTWTFVPTATSYNVSINDSVNTRVPIPSSGASQYMWSFTGLTKNTVYTVSVVAINCAGSSSPATMSNRTSPPMMACDTCTDIGTAVGVSVSVTFVVFFSMGVLVASVLCYISRRSKESSHKPSSHADPATNVYEGGTNQKMKGDAMEKNANSAY